MKPKSQSKPRKRARQIPSTDPFIEYGVTAAEVERSYRKSRAAFRSARKETLELLADDSFRAALKELELGERVKWKGVDALPD